MRNNAPGPRQAMPAILLFFVIGLSAGARAQTESASIRGTVTEHTGAYITNATVRLVDVDHGVTAELKTGNDGVYTFSNIYPGNYRMEVEKSWFKVLRLNSIT